MGYVIFLISIMIISGLIKKHHLFDCLFYLIQLKIKSKRLLVLIISTLGGILPIEGRVTLSAGILDTLTPNKTSTCSHSRSKFGIIDYLSTHHYYLWSPLEKTIVLPMAALGVGYLQILSITWPLLVISLAYLGYYLFFKLKETDIEINKIYKKFTKYDYLKILPFIGSIFLVIFGIPGEYIFGPLTMFYLYITKTFNFKDINKFINWKLVMVLIGILSISYLVGIYHSEMLLLISSLSLDITNYINLMLLSIIVFAVSWLLGSSGKFAGIVSILIALYGAHWFIWFFVIDFMAYNLSPTHKCVSIGNGYFGTKVINYFKVIGMWQLLLFLYAIIYTFIL